MSTPRVFETVCKALIYVYDVGAKKFTLKGEVYKAAGSKVTLQEVEGNNFYLRVIENGKPSSNYLRKQDVAEMVTA